MKLLFFTNHNELYYILSKMYITYIAKRGLQGQK